MMLRACRYIVLSVIFCAPVVADQRLPLFLIRLPDSVHNAFIAETATARFHHFENTNGRGLRHRGDTYMSIGQNGDVKQRTGDGKTPLGIYFVTEQLDTSRMHEKYGHTAFVLDYPNALDRRMQRSGDGIWVHGVDRRGGERPEWDTDGCIALPNDELAELEAYFKPNATPVIISRSVEWVAAARIETLRRELDAAVRLWLDSRRRGDLHAYLSLYDEDFRHWGMNRGEWVAFQTRLLSSRSLQSVMATDLLLLADPVEANTYLSRFRMETRESDNVVTVTKRLYWRRGQHGTLKLIAEDSG